MMNYLVHANTEALTVTIDAPWTWENIRLIETRKDNIFTEADIIMSPITRVCRHNAPNAQTLGTGWAHSGHWGFLKGTHCLIVHQSNVLLTNATGAAA